MLSETVHRTDDVPAGERLDWWRELMEQTIAPMEVTSEGETEFAANQRLLGLGESSVWPTTVGPSCYRRTERMIRHSDPERYHLTLLLPGSSPLRVNHGERDDLHDGPGLYVIDTSVPCEVRSIGDGVLVGVGVEVPKVLLPAVPGRRTDSLLGMPLSGQDGFGGLLAQFLLSLSTETDRYRSADAGRLGTVLLDLVSGLFAQHLDATGLLPYDTRRRNLLLRIRAFVERHLGDPRLTPGAIAAAHHLSTRQLHRLFKEEEMTVASLIRHRRLERVRRDLADPACRTTPIHAIAARWGFPAMAHFSRAFRAEYGMPPSEYRWRALEVGALAQALVAEGQRQDGLLPGTSGMPGARAAVTGG
ncbi:helix-turn-helix domain-containing protein [Streptomyces alkaliterrae]|uniref:Helix-turn-helix domain-containing protein n=1 Tax=Streptomyces alkaliterrae TaxID=2213162 RepID=A0A5P0YUB8_9ACTN|nr:helix-turn-helix domain-containing protein [Streptomyces alkaliterrae]MBB1261699.1 helix-turn-helix domain-containing protein [Streptomyces alkaliterrae]MQS03042.1 helix-turn-helix domain-containing protein [Streptomyces alkaliterrae]